MAAVAGIWSAHATLTTTAVDTVTITGPVLKTTVINRHATEDLWATHSNNGVAPADPVAAADGTYFVVPANGSVTFHGGNGIIIKLLGNGNPYSVQGYDSISTSGTGPGI